MKASVPLAEKGINVDWIKHKYPLANEEPGKHLVITTTQLKCQLLTKKCRADNVGPQDQNKLIHIPKGILVASDLNV
jgi:hypothetical protein